MDLLSFVFWMTRVLTWPLTAIAVAVLFRQSLASLIDRIRSARYGGMEIDFEKEMRVAEDLAKKSLPRSEETKTLEVPDERDLAEIASLNPAAAVAAAWADLERALLEVGEKRNLLRPEVRPESRPVFVARVLNLAEHLDRNDYRVFSQLHQLRNLAVHGGRPITKSEADEYISLVSRFVAKLSKL